MQAEDVQGVRACRERGAAAGGRAGRDQGGPPAGCWLAVLHPLTRATQPRLRPVHVPSPPPTLALTQEAGCYKVILDCSEENVPFYEKCGLIKKEVQCVRYL